MRTACQRIVPPIVEGLGKLIGTFDPEFQDKLKGRVLLAGGGSQIRGLDRAISEEMQRTLGGGNVIGIEEPMYGGANGALVAHDMPEEYWEQLKWASGPAAGGRRSRRAPAATPFTTSWAVGCGPRALVRRAPARRRRPSAPRGGRGVLRAGRLSRVADFIGEAARGWAA